MRSRLIINSYFEEYFFGSRRIVWIWISWQKTRFHWICDILRVSRIRQYWRYALNLTLFCRIADVSILAMICNLVKLQIPSVYQNIFGGAKSFDSRKHNFSANDRKWSYHNFFWLFGFADKLELCVKFCGWRSLW